MNLYRSEDQRKRFFKFLKGAMVFAFFAGLLIGNPASAQEFDDSNLKFQTLVQVDSEDVDISDYDVSDEELVTKPYDRIGNEANANATNRIGDSEDGEPVYKSYLFDDLVFRHVVWKIDPENNIEVLDEFSTEFETNPAIYHYDEDIIGTGSNNIAYDHVDNQVYELQYNDVSEETNKAELDNGQMTSILVNPDQQTISGQDPNHTDVLKTIDYEGNILKETDMDDVGVSSNFDEDAIAFNDIENDLWVLIYDIGDGDAEYAIGDDISALESGVLEDFQIESSDFQKSIVEYEDDIVILSFNDQNENNNGFVRYTDSDNEAGKDLVQDDDFDNIQHPDRYEVGDVYHDYSQNHISVADDSSFYLYDFSNQNADAGLIEEYDSTTSDIGAAAHTYYDTVEVVDDPVINSLTINPTPINFDDDFTVDFEAEDPNDQGIVFAEATLYDTDGTTSIAQVTEEYSSDNVVVSDSFSRQEFEDDAGTSELFESEGDYEIELLVQNEASEIEFESISFTVLSDFEISDPIPYTFDENDDRVEENFFDVRSEFQAEMEYINGRDEDEMDIYLKPVDGWDEPDITLEDSEWYSDTAIKTGGDGDGSVFSPISEVGIDFPFENTRGNFEMIGLANIGDSVPTIVDDSELDSFDLQTNIVEFEVAENNGVNISLIEPEDESEFDENQNVDFVFVSEDPDALGYEVDLVLAKDDEPEEIVFTDSVEQDNFDAASFNHTVENISSGSYEWRVDAEKQDVQYSSETRSFEVNEPSVFERYYDALVGALKDVIDGFVESMNERFSESFLQTVSILLSIAVGLIAFLLTGSKALGFIGFSALFAGFSLVQFINPIIMLSAITFAGIALIWWFVT